MKLGKIIDYSSFVFAGLCCWYLDWLMPNNLSGYLYYIYLLVSIFISSVFGHGIYRILMSKFYVININIDDIVSNMTSQLSTKTIDEVKRLLSEAKKDIENNSDKTGHK